MKSTGRIYDKPEQRSTHPKSCKTQEFEISLAIGV